MSLYEMKPTPQVLALIAHDVRWNLLRVLAMSDYRVQELSVILERPLNLISYHLRKLRDATLVHEHRSAADGRDVYYAVDLERLGLLYRGAAGDIHPALGETSRPADYDASTEIETPARVLFLCTHNSARSQMAEALLRHLAGNMVEVFSAGTEATEVHPMALETLHRNNVETTGLASKHLSQFVGQHFDYVITVCDNARESCPVFPGDPYRIHWSFRDPAAAGGEAEQRIAFADVFAGLEKRLHLLISLIRRDHTNP